MRFKQKSEWEGGRDLGEEHSKQREQHVQRPWGRTVPDMLEEQRDLCVWSTVSEGDRGRR